VGIFYGLPAFFGFISTDNLQALSIVLRQRRRQDTPQHWGVANGYQRKLGGKKMKLRVWLVLLVMGMMASYSVKAHAISCNNLTVKGTYAFTIRGQILLPGGSSLLITGIARTTFDGHGNITQLDAVAANGNVASDWRFSTGTYSVNTDCTATFTVTNGDAPPIHALFLVAQSGNTLHAVVIDPGFAVTSDAERVVAPQM
jgi:hypothetical protein